MNVRVEEAVRLEHIRGICEALRERERRAFQRLNGEPERLITQEVARSLVAYVGLLDEQPVALWGARTSGIFDKDAYVWLVCTQHIEAFPQTFLRHSRRALTILRCNFEHVNGLVLEEFDCSVKWLEWLGFTVDEPKDGLRAFHL